MGPLLFNLLLDDVNFSDQIACSLRLYADDTFGYSSSVFPSILQVNLQDNLSLLTTWFRKNFLAVNNTKSQLTVLNGASLPAPFTIDNNHLDYVSQIKLLGVTIDSSLSFQTHIKDICHKVKTKVSILRRIRKFMPIEIIIKLYKAFILPTWNMHRISALYGTE